MTKIQQQVLDFIEETNPIKGKYLEINERLSTLQNIDNSRFTALSSTAFICTFAGMALGNYCLMLYGEKLQYEMSLANIKNIEKVSESEYKITEVYGETIYRISSIKIIASC